MVETAASVNHREREEAMAEDRGQLALRERGHIEEGLTRGDPFRAIARTIGRSSSTVLGEMLENRHVRAFKACKSACL